MRNSKQSRPVGDWEHWEVVESKNKEVIIANNIFERNDNMSLEQAILLSMITASYKDKIIDEITYQNMIQKLHI